MGNGPSSEQRRSGQQQQQQQQQQGSRTSATQAAGQTGQTTTTPTRVTTNYPSASQQQPSYHPAQPGVQYYPQPAYSGAGSYYSPSPMGQAPYQPGGGYPGSYYPPPVPTYTPPAHYGQQPAPQAAPRMPVQTQEYQNTATIRNQVNLKKPTLKLQPRGQPNVLAITFNFDASAACRVTTFINAYEDASKGCKIFPGVLPAPPAVTFNKGLDHTFSPAATDAAGLHVIDVSSLTNKELTTHQGDTFPIIVRLEALTDEGRAEGRSLAALEPGCELPQWVQSQTTYARLAKEEDGSWGIRVIKQKIWFKGTAYELQEIYGMEQTRVPGQAVDGFEDVDGNECVICMSAPRDTTALPCRHMCMCHACASALKNQTNKCPICRNEIESLLHIKINKANKRANEAAGAGAQSLI